MAPFKRPQKRRRTSSAGSRRSASRAESRQSTLRRENSSQPSSGCSSNSASTNLPIPRPSPESIASTRTFAIDDDRSVGTAGPGELDGDLDFLEEVVMAVNLLERGTLGCAYYVAKNETLYFMEDTKLASAALIETCELRSSD